MRKKYSTIHFISVLITLITGVVFCLSACAKSNSSAAMPKFKKSYSMRDDIYPVSFKTYTAKSNCFELNVSEKVYDMGGSVEYYNQINDDMELIADEFGSKNIKQVSFFLVNDTYDGGCYAKEGRVYCSLDDIESKNYRTALMKAALCIPEPWMAYGAYSYVFCEEPNGSALTEYIAASEDTDIFSLFGAYFCPEFASENEMAAVKDAASSFASYIIKEYGTDAFLSGETVSYKSDWLEKIGVSAEIPSNYDEVLSNLIFSHSKDYPLIINSDKAQFYFQLIPENIETAGQVKSAVIDALDGSAKIMNYIKNNAPINYERLKDNPDGIKYYFVPETWRGLSTADSNNKEIHALHSSVIIHELMHIIIPKSKSDESYWQYEGIAEYFNYNVYPSLSVKEGYFNYLTEDFSGASNRDKVLSYCQSYYLSHAATPGKAENMDAGLFNEALAVVSVTHPELRYESKAYQSVMEFAGKKQNTVVGNELTYAQSYLFISYLIDNYSLDIVLDYCRPGADFEEIFGDSYERVKSEWINSLIYQ